jgi:prepilin-type N-terminal cleavage/methylation domain-containing protein
VAALGIGGGGYLMRTRRGFTVLEMLVVIGIIAFMIAMMGVMLWNARIRAQQESTKALIENISISLSTYEGIYRALPPDTGYGLSVGGNANYDAGSLYRYLSLSAKTGKGLPLKVPAENLRDYNDPMYGPSKMVVDAWGHPIGYIGDRKRLIHNRDGVDIFSAGPDKKTACDDGIDNGKFFGVCNTAYDGSGPDDAGELGESALNGTLTDDLNNWSK